MWRDPKGGGVIDVAVGVCRCVTRLGCDQRVGEGSLEGRIGRCVTRLVSEGWGMYPHWFGGVGWCVTRLENHPQGWV